MSELCHGYPCYPDGMGIWIIAFGAAVGFSLSFIILACIERKRRDGFLAALFSLASLALFWIGNQSDGWSSVHRALTHQTAEERDNGH